MINEIASIASSHSEGMLLASASFVLLAGSPGPATLAIMGTAMKHGRKQGTFLALGVLAGSLTWGVFAVLGLNQFINSFPEVLQGLKVLGGFYLLWLAAKALKSARDSERSRSGDVLQNSTASSRHWSLHFIKGYAIHITNPKALIAWMAIITLSVDAATPDMVGYIVLAICAVLGGIIFLSYALLFSSAKMVAVYKKASSVIETIASCLFGVAGVSLIYSAREP